MSKQKLFFESFFSSLAVVLYILLVSYVMNNAEHWFGNNPGILGAVAFLLLFVISAAIVGSLVMGHSTMLWLSGMKREGVTLFVFNVGWMVIGIAVIMLILL
jgi:hypothetical protein